jgi:2-dehydropantoate 2-reductase
LMANSHTSALVERIMGEVQLVAQTYNCHITDEFIQTMLAYTHKMTPYRTSMKIDYDEGRALEIDTMFRHPLKFARKKGLSVPSIEMLYQQLHFLTFDRSN